MSNTVSITVNTTDTRTLGIVGRMLLELAGEVTGALVVAEAVNEPKLDTAAALAQAAESTIDTAAALAHTGDDEPAPTSNGDFTPAQLAAAVTAAPAPPVPPTPPSAAVAPPAPAAAPSAPQGGVELDKNNLPWDARINTSNKVKTQQGVWKMKKGLPEGLYDQVVAELKGVMAAPAAPQAPAAPAAPAAPQAPAAPAVAGIPGMVHNYSVPGMGGVHTTAPGQPVPAGGMLLSTDPMPTPAPPAAPQAPAAPAAPQAPVPPTPPQPPAAATGDEPTTYAQLLAIVGKQMAGQKITAAECNFACAQHGIESLTLLDKRPDLVPAVYQAMAAIWSGR